MNDYVIKTQKSEPFVLKTQRSEPFVLKTQSDGQRIQGNPSMQNIGHGSINIGGQQVAHGGVRPPSYNSENAKANAIHAAQYTGQNHKQANNVFVTAHQSNSVEIGQGAKNFVGGIEPDEPQSGRRFGR